MTITTVGGMGSRRRHGFASAAWIPLRLTAQLSRRSDAALTAGRAAPAGLAQVCVHTSLMSTTGSGSAELREAIRSAPMFDGLDAAQVDFLAAQSRAIFVASGQVLFRKGTRSTGFCMVRAGLMQLSVSNSEGVVKVVEILRPGSAFGHAVMFVREPYPVGNWSGLRGGC
ncbi:MAG: cyclic nucleotide-binding domain-containing protein, partial [Mycobacterium sp.]|nr:cyclic nucleotide-binding domain-containing protein [Mycobacterium sp.]